ncbi:MAG: bifunctional diaminohydroxyphosphoribosylaminopyrimidine deaminase/5-amino-6-(5-phosphoribosylamino)uracil reductase RibD [Dehalococcoidia bacterium]|jgi:diaminohydroxyphosphoribosylaminopyrimidine deaminase / 5-amino-6-(5-phosphoribosylamino)uracil reductase|nr:bifunctional diaminohydroxyphosphoribosylaminopyrimidine deaminase/5-amino-6-(5-phosphoribosylamino)uracil reductase RibD [Dehalococcoidia bacterium]
MPTDTTASPSPTPSPHMRAALQQAAAAQGTTSPNPPVGAVIVRNGEIIARGHTQQPASGAPRRDGSKSSGAHAEVMALAAAGDRARGAEVYVTLEPCAHHGRTPPCTDALIQAGVAAVHYALRDPFPEVDGRGHQLLQDAGIQVTTGDGAHQSRELLAGYLKHQATGLPLVIVKYAASLDGKIAAASGDSRWVSGPDTLAWAHRQRPTLDAIVVGSNTVLLDDPQLTARPADPHGPADPGGTRETVDPAVHQPIRIVADSRGRIAPTARIFQGAPDLAGPTIVATTAQASPEWRATIEATGAEILELPTHPGAPDPDGVPTSHVDLAALVTECGNRGMLNLLFEGGGVILGSLFDQRLVDRVHAIIAPLIIGAAAAPGPVAGTGADRMADAVGLRDITVERLGADILVTGTPVWPD